jgi:hypothetical protein
MFDDPIVLETRILREEYAASFDYDLGRIVADLQARQGSDGRTVVDRTSIREADQYLTREPSEQPMPHGESTPLPP